MIREKPCTRRKAVDAGKSPDVNPVGYLETSVIQCADNLAALGQMPDECVDLVYLDPPFFSNRNVRVET